MHQTVTLEERHSLHSILLQKEEAAIVMVKKNLGVLDEYLASHTYLVGNSVTLADIIGVANLYHGYTKV